MRKINVTNNVTLDGVMQAPGGKEEDTRNGFEYGGWAAPYNDDVKMKIMGRGMARRGALACLYRGEVCMTKAELVDHVAATVQLPKHQIETVLTQFLQGIMDALQAGDKVELRGFGSFRLRHRQAREGRNPRTGDTVPIPAKAVPSFTAGKAFQETVQTRPAPSDSVNGVPR